MGARAGPSLAVGLCRRAAPGTGRRQPHRETALRGSRLPAAAAPLVAAAAHPNALAHPESSPRRARTAPTRPAGERLWQGTMTAMSALSRLLAAAALLVMIVAPVGQPRAAAEPVAPTFLALH